MADDYLVFYHSDHAPEGQEVIGILFCNGIERLEMVFRGSSEEAVAKEARKYLDDEGLSVDHLYIGSKPEAPLQEVVPVKRGRVKKEADPPSDKVWYHNPETGETKRCLSTEIPKGWQKGRG